MCVHTWQPCSRTCTQVCQHPSLPLLSTSCSCRPFAMCADFLTSTEVIMSVAKQFLEGFSRKQAHNESESHPRTKLKKNIWSWLTSLAYLLKEKSDVNMYYFCCFLFLKFHGHKCLILLGGDVLGRSGKKWQLVFFLWVNGVRLQHLSTLTNKRDVLCLSAIATDE